jgi:uncharacterized phage-associated protein
VPSESNGKMIAAIRDKNVLLGLLNGCKDVFQQAEYNRILTSIRLCEDRNTNSPLYCVIFNDDKRTIFNGYGYKSVAKLFEMVQYIVWKHGEVFPTKLNKLMFYSDFHNYRKTGQSISGLQYRALNFGPVPDHYATIYDNVPGLEKKLVEAHDMVGTLLIFNGDKTYENLSSAEKNSIDYVVDSLKQLSVSAIIEESHKESGWQNYSDNHDYIAYDEAFNLKLI